MQLRHTCGRREQKKRVPNAIATRGWKENKKNENLQEAVVTLDRTIDITSSLRSENCV